MTAYVDHSRGRVTMTRQHFELIARVVREVLEHRGDPMDGEALVAEFSRALAGTNGRFDRGRFDRGRFERACGLETGS